jgi:hypothetical protein
MNTIRNSLAVGLTALASVAVAATPAAAASPGCTMYDNGFYCEHVPGARVRSGPSTTYPVITNLGKNSAGYYEVVTVCWKRGQQHSGGNNVWYQVVRNGTRGWVAAVNFRTTVDPHPEATAC